MEDYQLECHQHSLGQESMRAKEFITKGFANDMSTKDMIAYLRQHHDTNLHQDYLNHINTFSKFVLQNVPVNSIKTDLPKLDREKVEQYKQMDFSKAPPIVMGGGYILDGYHRANVAKALGIPTIKAYVGVQGVAEGSSNNIPTIGINVRSDKDIDYASLIVDGKKKYESRKTDSLRPYVGKTVGIVRTGNGPAVAIGQVTIGEPIIVDAEKFNKLRNQHLVPQGSKFDIDSDGTKYLYPMINPVRWDNEKPIKHKGIVSRKIQEQDVTELHTQLWHGTSEPADVIQQQGLRGGRHHAVFLTDNPDLALEYAVSDQERTGNDYVTLITVDVSKLDQKKLVGDLDHTTVDNWIDSLKETDQCMYLGDILPNMITNVEDYTDQ